MTESDTSEPSSQVWLTRAADLVLLALVAALLWAMGWMGMLRLGDVGFVLIYVVLPVLMVWGALVAIGSGRPYDAAMNWGRRTILAGFWLLIIPAGIGVGLLSGTGAFGHGMNVYELLLFFFGLPALALSLVLVAAGRLIIWAARKGAIAKE